MRTVRPLSQRQPTRYRGRYLPPYAAHHLHLLYPESRQKSHPLACSSWPRHSGNVAIIEDMIAGRGVGGRGSVTPTADFDARAESGWPFKRRLVIMMHSATACSGEVSRRSLNQT